MRFPSLSTLFHNDPVYYIEHDKPRFHLFQRKSFFFLFSRRLPGRHHDCPAPAEDQLPLAADVPALGALRDRGLALPLPARGVHPREGDHGHDHTPHPRRHVRRGQVRNGTGSLVFPN